MSIKNNYWSSRYLNDDTPWDMCTPSPPLIAFCQNLVNKSAKILIPGSGNAYEAEWLWQNGFRNTYVIDIAAEPLENLQKRCPDFPSDQLLLGDFFELDQKFDLIIEQTFFCALEPGLREDYAHKMAKLLYEGGKLIGVLFNFPLSKEGPPYGGSVEEYVSCFKKYLSIHKIEPCYNSVKPRQGNELFIHLIKA